MAFRKPKQQGDNRTPEQIIDDGFEKAMTEANRIATDIRREVIMAFCYGVDCGESGTARKNRDDAQVRHDQALGASDDYSALVKQKTTEILTRIDQEQLPPLEDILSKHVLNVKPSANPVKLEEYRPPKAVEVERELNKSGEIPKAEADFPGFLTKGKAAG